MLTALVVLAMVACAHEPPPPPPAPPPPPKPPGDTVLKLTLTPGDVVRAHARLAIEQDVAGEKAQKDKSPSARHLELSFEFSEEEKVESLAADGTATVRARLADVIGKVGQGGNQDLVDRFALALDELKVTFLRTPRGETTALVLTGVRPPLEVETARAMLNSLYAAQRGPLFPDEAVRVGDGWKAHAELPASTGFSGLVTYQYKLERKGGGVAVVSGMGSIDGKGGGKETPRSMTGASTSEYRVDLEAGRFIGTVVDSMVDIEQMLGTPPTKLEVKQHVHAEWMLTELPSTAPAEPSRGSGADGEKP